MNSNSKKILDKNFNNLPDQVIWCKKCFMSNQRPMLKIYEDGICSACKYSEYKNSIDWKKRESELEELLSKFRKSNGNWDVIVPSSGGKDSFFVAHQLKFKYNMNPLLLTFSPLLYTKVGKKNFDNLNNLGFSSFLYSPDPVLKKKLARLCFEEYGDAFHMFVLGQANFPLHMAIKLKIELIFYGENSHLEYAGDYKFNDNPYDDISRIYSRIFKGTTFKDLINFGIREKDYIKKEDFKNRDINFYEPPSKSEIENMSLKKAYFGYFKKWVPQEMYYYATKNSNFEPNEDRNEGTFSKFASLDDKTDGFHYYMRYIKLGLGRCAEDVSHHIRDGLINRDEGKMLMKKFEGEFPKKYFKEFLEFLNINENEFNDVVDSWRRPKLWKKSNKLDGNWEILNKPY